MHQDNHDQKHNQKLHIDEQKSIQSIISALAQQTAELGETTSLKGYALWVSGDKAVTAPGTPQERLPVGTIAVTYPDIFQVGATVDALLNGQANRKLLALIRMARRIRGRYPTASEYEYILRLVDGFLVAGMLANLEAEIPF